MSISTSDSLIMLVLSRCCKSVMLVGGYKDQRQVYIESFPLYSDDGLTSETSVSILSFLLCRIYIFITKLFL